MPANRLGEANSSTIILYNWQKEEDVVRQRDTLTPEIFALLLGEAKKVPLDSDVAVVSNWMCVTKCTGLRNCEYAQKI